MTRNEAIRTQVASGLSMADVGKIYGISRQRVEQIVKPDRHVARKIVLTAIKNGEMERGACESCGTHDDVEAHHEDYNKPLEVQWLCRVCHVTLHGRELRTCPVCGVQKLRKKSAVFKHCSRKCGQRGRDPNTRTLPPPRLGPIVSRSERVADAALRLRQLVSERGYVPGITELAIALTGGEMSTLGQWLDPGQRVYGTYAAAADAVYEAAGLRRPTYGRGIMS